MWELPEAAWGSGRGGSHVPSLEASSNWTSKPSAKLSRRRAPCRHELCALGKLCGQKNLDSHTLGSHRTGGPDSEIPRQRPPSSSWREPGSSTNLPHPSTLADTNAHPRGWTVRDLEPTRKRKKIINIKPNSHHLQKLELFSSAEQPIYITRALSPFGIRFLSEWRVTGH